MRYLRTVELPIDGLQPFPGNARIHDDAALDESAEENGQYRSVVAREMGRDALPQVLAGHGTWGAFTRRGDKTIRVELIEATDREARRIVLADNSTSRRAGYDERLLLELVQAADADGGLSGTGYDDADLRDLLDSGRDLLDGEGTGDGDDADGAGEDGDAYTSTVNIPHYAIVGPRPALEDLRDETRADALRARIREAEIPDDVREFLLAAAARHTVFNYRLAAEFYPHAEPEVQALMEESALVIIDVEDAIRLGFARLSATLTGIRQQDEAASVGR